MNPTSLANGAKYHAPTIDAPEIAKVFVEKLDLTLWCIIGAAHRPRKGLESNLSSERSHLLKINKTRTTAHQPQLDDMVEQFKQGILQHLSKVNDEHQEDRTTIFHILC